MKNLLKYAGWLAVLALALFMPWYGTLLGERANAKDRAEPAVITTDLSLEPRVMVMRQDAQGVTEADLDAAGAQRFAAYAAQRASYHAAQYAAQQGWEIPENPVTGEGVVIEADGRRLVVIRLKGDGLVIAVEVAGIDGAELVRVTCTNDGQSDARLTDPACLDQVERTFAVRIALDAQ